MNLSDEIKACIKAQITDAQVFVHDPDGAHFSARVVSAVFEDMPRIKQHRLVMNALKEQLGTNRVHALQLKTFTPAKWEAEKDNFI